MSIPPKTLEKIQTNQGVGERHRAALDIAMSLVGNGMEAGAIFALLRGKFTQEKTDKELQDVIRYAISKNPTASQSLKAWMPRPMPATRIIDPIDKAKWWLSGEEKTFAQVSASSPIPINESARQCTIDMLEMLYAAQENINVVCRYTMAGEKANPQGSGKTLSRSDWAAMIRADGVPQSQAGAWMRPNPVTPIGSGADGAITDADVAAHRFLLVESDKLPIEIQLAFYLKLKAPIALILSSGGKSVHAWLRLDAVSSDDYSEKAKRVLTLLQPFGIDQANKNASRLSRLVGATRTIGAASSGGEQSLLYLNPACGGMNDKAIEDLAYSLEFPALEEKPFRRVFQDAVDRYEALWRGEGAIGLKTGLPSFDKTSGGMKNGQMIVIAGETGGGKTTLAMNIISHVLAQGVGVLLFSMEMDRDEIADMFISMRCKIDRNNINTGKFQDGEMVAMTANAPQMVNLPLWIEDEAIVTPDKVRARTLQLCAASRIGLLVVDYIQFLTSENSRDSREQQVAQVSRAIRALAKEAKIPVIVISQLNDDGKLRESRVIAHDAHVVALIEDGKLRIVKGRNIPKLEFELYFNPSLCTMREQCKAAPIDREDVPETKKPYRDE